MADVLPLKSTFFDWCSEYFTEPQMRVRRSLLFHASVIQPIDP
jgi:hypothetical protein